MTIYIVNIVSIGIFHKYRLSSRHCEIYIAIDIVIVKMTENIAVKFLGWIYWYYRS